MNYVDRNWNETWKIRDPLADRRRRNGSGLLFFIAPDRKLMVVEVKLGTTFEMGTPVALFQTQISNFTSPNRYDVSADGQRFLVNTSVQEANRNPFVVILDWVAGIKK